MYQYIDLLILSLVVIIFNKYISELIIKIQIRYGMPLVRMNYNAWRRTGVSESFAKTITGIDFYEKILDNKKYLYILLRAIAIIGSLFLLTLIILDFFGIIRDISGLWIDIIFFLLIPSSYFIGKQIVNAFDSLNKNKS